MTCNGQLGIVGHLDGVHDRHGAALYGNAVLLSGTLVDTFTNIFIYKGFVSQFGQIGGSRFGLGCIAAGLGGFGFSLGLRIGFVSGGGAGNETEQGSQHKAQG